MPRTPFIGVRISWLMLARKLDFARLAPSASESACARSLVRSAARAAARTPVDCRLATRPASSRDKSAVQPATHDGRSLYWSTREAREVRFQPRVQALLASLNWVTRSKLRRWSRRSRMEEKMRCPGSPIIRECAVEEHSMLMDPRVAERAPSEKAVSAAEKRSATQDDQSAAAIGYGRKSRCRFQSGLVHGKEEDQAVARRRSRRQIFPCRTRLEVSVASPVSRACSAAALRGGIPPPESMPITCTAALEGSA